MTATAPARTDHRLGFTTLDREVSLDRLPLSGELPAWLQGSLVRTGPAAFEAGGPPLRHWFDGLAMLHAFSFADGQVAYANRWLHSDAWKEARRGEMSLGEFGTDPCRSIFRRAMSMFSPGATDNGNVNVTRLGDRFLAMTETPMPIEFDPRTLETIGHAPVAPTGDGQLTTAHPHLDHRDGALLNYATRFSRTSTYRVYARRADEAKRRVLASIKARRPSYMHSFGMTERHAVLVEFPLVVDPLRLAFGGRPFIENYRWEPERGTRIHLVPLDGGEPLGPFVTEPFFCFHHINAYERRAATWSSTCAPTRTPRSSTRSISTRCGPAASCPTTGPGGSRSHAAEARCARSSSATRTSSCRASTTAATTAAPTGTCGACAPTGRGSTPSSSSTSRPATSTTWSEDGVYPGEPVFVPAPSENAEDDGVLLSVILDADRGTSSLLVLDAQTLAERARAEVPHHIPHGFHGQYFGGL